MTVEPTMLSFTLICGNFIDILFKCDGPQFYSNSQRCALLASRALYPILYSWKSTPETIFIIPTKFYFKNIGKKSLPGTPRGHALLLAVQGSGPHPDGHGHFAPIFSESGAQELSFDTLNLGLRITQP